MKRPPSYVSNRDDLKKRSGNKRRVTPLCRLLAHAEPIPTGRHRVYCRDDFLTTESLGLASAVDKSRSVCQPSGDPRIASYRMDNASTPAANAGEMLRRLIRADVWSVEIGSVAAVVEGRLLQHRGERKISSRSQPTPIIVVQGPSHVVLRRPRV
jgi:hypothetical protein